MSKEIVGLLSNKLNVSDQYTQVLDIGPVQFQPYTYSADGNSPYNSQIQFNNIVPVGSLSQTLLSKNMRVRYQVSVLVVPNATTPITRVFPSTSYYQNTAVNSGFRAFPLQQVCDTVQISLNSSTQTWNSRQTLSLMSRLLDKKALMNRVEECPVRPDDQFLLLPQGQGVDNVLSITQNANLDYSRNAIQPISVVDNGAAGITYTYQFTENLLIPGINSIWDNDVCLGNINNLSLVMSWSGLADMICSAPLYAAGTFTPYNDTVTVSLSNAFLDLFYNTVDPSIVSIPRVITYPFENVNWFSKTQALVDLAVVNDVSVSSDTIRLLSCPKYIGYALRRPINNRGSGTNIYQADSCLTLGKLSNAGIGSVSINYGAKSGLLSQASRDSIYRFSRECGSNQTHNDFIAGSGAWTWIDPTKHFGLSADDLHVGEGGNVNLQINATYSTANCLASAQSATAGTAVLPTADALEFIIVVIYEGQMVVSPDMVNYSLSVLTPAEINTLMNKGNVVSKEAVKMEGKGAGLYSDKSVLMKGARPRGGVLSAAGLGGSMGGAMSRG